MSKARDLFKAAVDGKKIGPPRDNEEDQVGGLRGIYPADRDFILGEHALRKYGSRQFYGPGAPANEETPAAEEAKPAVVVAPPLPPQDPPPAAPEGSRAKKKKGRRGKLEDLAAETERLRREIAALEGRTK